MRQTSMADLQNLDAPDALGHPHLDAIALADPGMGRDSV